ncbi:RNA polymerase sigma factor [Prevotella sp. OH937_COT-195]|uniref:RNA polymerase sigma factor n=1 Tax=Prevotella sp. OH937_COT-195 TaxID=2491051 RepID=UPI0013150799|nr:sigma-70 family RNA polymerase sigma factor [Prevotella sp. OH937_COT-195]
MPRRDEVEHLYCICYGKMCRLAGIMLNDDDEGCDVASEVFARLSEGGLRLPVDKEENYLLSCVRNRCLDIIARMKVKERVIRHLTLDVSPTVVPVEEREHKIERMLCYAERELTPQTMRVFKLRFEGRKSYREISDMLGISETSVYKNLSKALVKLKEFADNDE